MSGCETLKATDDLKFCFHSFTDQPMLNAAMCAAMDDILIVTTKQSELGILWVNYLKACFDKITKQRGRMPFK